MSLGVVLSGGGVRCVAQLAILEAFREEEISINAYAAASGGALVASLLLSGVEPAQILSLATNLRLLKQVKPAWQKSGLLSAEAALSVFTQYLAVDFSQLSSPLFIAATELSQGKYHIFSEGNLPLAVVASCCMPVIFTPQRVNDRYYVDAGLVNNLPVEPLADCSCIVGIHTNPIQPDFADMNFRSLVERSFLLAINGNVAERKKSCHVYLEPTFLGEYRVFEFKKIAEIYARSREWIQPRMPGLKSRILEIMSQNG